MASRLFLGGDRYITVDTIFADGGQPAHYAMAGGQRIMVAAGVPPKPTIYRVGERFYYADGQQPVSRLEDITHVPREYRAAAEKFVREQSGDAKPLVAQKRSGRPPGRPPKLKKIVIDSEQALAAAHGGPLPE